MKLRQNHKKYSSLLENIDDVKQAISLISPFIKNMIKFPMRKFNGPIGEKQLIFESKIKKNFLENRCNLFSLCSSPEYFLEKGKNLFFEDYLAYQFWITSLEIEQELIYKFWPKTVVQQCIHAGLISQKLTLEGTKLLSNFRIIPFRDMFLIADRYDRTYNDMVYLSYDSLVLAEFLAEVNYQGQVICDICSGSGILGLTISKNCPHKQNESVIHSIDINPRAIECAQVNSALNELALQGHVSTYSNCKSFISTSDIVVFNPPFIFGPASRLLLDSDGGEQGIEHTFNILKLINRNLKIGGRYIGISQSPIIQGKDVLWNAVQQFETLEINYHVLDEFKPFSRYSEWYASHGVEAIRQIIIFGDRMPTKAAKIFNNKSEIGKYCFS
ncbi:methyltransferase [Desulfobacter latus]|uniref:Class I SAM-dependent methyltransferase n=1 Tax=Desulfobacter latus TaxID=2292 RepID=A0A850SZW3_9BACT|nr:class I SAM-dependent methyltransferase [Desulfobacter latus]NWH04983.1 class I SAM-dependent methyltransferase [Desulfobacter latus]